MSLRRVIVESLALALVLGGIGCGSGPVEADSDGSGTGDAGSGQTGSGDVGSDSDSDSDSDSGADADAGSTDTGADAETTDTGTTGSPGDPDNWNFGSLFGVPNLDDDDQNGSADWYDVASALDDDLSTLFIPAEALPPGTTIDLRLGGSTSSVRVWFQGEAVLGESGGGALTTASIDPMGGQVVLEVEWDDYLSEATLTLDRLDEGGAVQRSVDVLLLASPMILNHHLQPAEHVYVTSVNGNSEFRDGYASALSSAQFTAVPGSSVGYDVWMQDEDEFGTSTAPGKRLDTIVDSIRDRGLDAFAESYLRGPDVIVDTWGTPGEQTSYDSFGNLDASPPVTVDGVEYPFGRIYYGKLGSEGLHSGLESFLQSQMIQAPFRVDTTWLCVGHVDEYSSFVPDPSSPKGFKFLMADTNAGYALLDSLAQSTSLPQYQWDYGYGSVSAMAGDFALRSMNQDLQIDHLEPILDVFKAELGLTEADVIRVPSIFETVSGCGGDVAALIPGMVNLTVANFAGDTPILFVPDPFMRSNPGSTAGDAFLASFSAAMPAGLTTIYLDNWDTYHTALGEVHCGTNVLRTPTADWWTDGLHLIGQ